MSCEYEYWPWCEIPNYAIFTAFAQMGLVLAGKWTMIMVLPNVEFERSYMCFLFFSFLGSCEGSGNKLWP